MSTMPGAKSPNIPVRIAHLVLGLPVGGTETLVYQMLKNPPEGFLASAICLDQKGVLGERAENEGISVACLNRRPGLDWRLPWRIARYCRSREVDILHCHHYTPWFYGILARMLRPKTRVVFTEHGRLHPDPPSPKRRLFNRVMERYTHRITAVSPATAEALVEVEAFDKNRVEVVYNGVDGGVYDRDGDRDSNRTALRARFGLRPDFVYFALCCRFDSIKWLDGLVQAVAEVKNAHPETGLLLLGDGDMRPKLEAMVKTLGLEENVVMPGFRSDVADWLHAADVFVLSSHSEGTSVSLIESMAAGLPAVVTRVGGNVHIVTEGENGLLVPPADVHALAAAMLIFARDPKKRRLMGAAARRRFRENFRLEKMFAKYATLYHAVLNGRNA